jgi:hypothetical protein
MPTFESDNFRIPMLNKSTDFSIFPSENDHSACTALFDLPMLAASAADWLVLGQITPCKPLASARCLAYSSQKG